MKKFNTRIRWSPSLYPFQEALKALRAGYAVAMQRDGRSKPREGDCTLRLLRKGSEYNKSAHAEIWWITGSGNLDHREKYFTDTNLLFDKWHIEQRYEFFIKYPVSPQVLIKLPMPQ